MAYERFRGSGNDVLILLSHFGPRQHHGPLPILYRLSLYYGTYCLPPLQHLLFTYFTVPIVFLLCCTYCLLPLLSTLLLYSLYVSLPFVYSLTLFIVYDVTLPPVYLPYSTIYPLTLLCQCLQYHLFTSLLYQLSTSFLNSA